jgi:diguanylate cyclase (GGDEF)-like protein
VTSRTSPPPNPLARGLVVLLAGVLLVGVSGFAAWAALSTRASAGGATSASRLADAYQQARLAVTRIELYEHAFRLQPDPATAAKERAALADLRGALASVVRNGDAHDRAVARDLDARAAQLVPGWRALMLAVQRGDAVAVDRIDRQRLSPRLAGMEVTVNAAAAGHRKQLFAGLRAARRSETIVVTAMVVMLGLCLLLLMTVSMILRYRRRLELAAVAEMARLRGAALTDSLTALANHRAFQEALKEREAAGTDLCLAMIDLDRLKVTNDAHGHQAGDELITSLARSLRAVLAPGAVAYRIGGDEFAVVLDGGRTMSGFYLAQNLRAALQRDGRRASATVGIAESWEGWSRDDLIRRADLALVEGKRSHRGTLVYSPGLEAPNRGPAEQTAHATTLATALARAVDAKDSYTHSHCETVAELCALMAERLGLPPARVAQVRLAGLLHDVGKIGVSDGVLQKPGPLTPDEWAAMQMHPALGSHIVSAAELYEEAGWILHHHERLDGGGYPDRLCGEEIPLESRIIMVADAFEAITAVRPYRARRSVAEALSELDRHAGTQFDPACVHALRALVSEGEQGAAPDDQLRQALRLAA